MTFKYVTTDIVTGATLHSDLPFTPSNISMNMMDPDSLSGTVSLTEASTADMIRPRRTLLWAVEGSTPVAAGVIWSVDMRDPAEASVGITCKGIESLLDHRILMATMDFVDKDIAYILRSLLDAATTAKASGDIDQLLYGTDNDWTNYLSDTYEVGITTSISFLEKDHKSFMKLIDDLAAAYEFEYRFVPSLIEDELKIVVMVARELAAPLGLTLSYPGELTGYTYQVNGSSSANTVYAVAQAEADGTQVVSDYASGKGVWSEDLVQGYPLLESVLSSAGSSFTTQEEADAAAEYALNALKLGAPPTIELTLTDTLMLANLVPGGVVSLSLTSYLHPSIGGAPGMTGTYRITSVSSDTETASLALDEYNV